jgi:eukaryotic-like serine/threonine-protein kinase
MRHPRRMAAIMVFVLALTGATVVFFANRTEPGTGGPVKTPTRVPSLSDVRLASSAASDYDPEGDGEESPEAARNAIDGNPPTSWNTETYQGGFEGSDKSGVGLYVDAGKRIPARELGLVTSTPGFKATVYASNTVPGGIGGWQSVSRNQRVREKQTFDLDLARSKFRNYLLWITELPEGGKVEIQELGLRS